MILSVRIRDDVEINYDDDTNDTPTPQHLDATLNILRLHAINTWMAMPTILETDADLNAVNLDDTETEAADVTEGDA